MKIKFEIKNRWTGKVVFEYKSENNTFRNTILEALRTGADLTGANLTGADLTGADLTGADLSGANLTGADLTDADLTGTNLTGANLTGADLTGADLTGADLTGADLSGADLTAIKNDLFIVLLYGIPEIAHLKQAIIEGKIDGSCYDGACSCLSGTMCKNAAPAIKSSLMTVRSESRPIELFFLGIKPGHTPENNPKCKLLIGWIEEFEFLINRKP